MKVLFVSSGNKPSGINNIVLSQGKSLQSIGIDLDYFQIIGHGIKGYLKAIRPIMEKLKHGNYDIVHAHYSLSGLIAALAGANPLIVSLMGSDVKNFSLNKLIILFCNRFYWDKIIVKSLTMRKILSLPGIEVIPNGIDLFIFRPLHKKLAQEKLQWDVDKFHILFPSDPSRIEKNYKLFCEAFKLVSRQNAIIHQLINIEADILPYYYNASDVMVLTSLREGSPNVIKEAMACNVPIVSTDVGDVRWVIGDTEGCFMTTFEPEDIASKLNKCITYSFEKSKTNGRERIIKLGLDSETIARRIENIYKCYAKGS